MFIDSTLSFDQDFFYHHYILCSILNIYILRKCSYPKVMIGWVRKKRHIFRIIFCLGRLLLVWFTIHYTLFWNRWNQQMSPRIEVQEHRTNCPPLESTMGPYEILTLKPQTMSPNGTRTSFFNFSNVQLFFWQTK
jgi:hypothetical protein